MTNAKQYLIDRPAPAVTGAGLTSVPQGEMSMFPFYEAIVADRQQESLREARRMHLAREAQAARRQHQPESGVIHELRQAVGVALVRFGQAILPREDCRSDQAA
ncbi:MAG TPA: hypothetical protein VFW92_03965 [Candidatus Limnocylindrales bacterium]|nr:hypothetical protein [Candidatus Limnocylindrales bacterium]